MDHPVTYESALKRSLLQDVTSFIRHFRSDALLNYSDFLLNWSEMDFDLLALVSTPEHILTCLIQLGLFGPTRPFPDHQLLVFFLFSFYKAARKQYKISADRMQFFLGVRMRARMLGNEGQETLEALESLFKADAFIITVVNDSSNTLSASSSTNLVTADQLIDRINRIDNFLHQFPLFSPSGSSTTLSRASLTRLKTSFERYYDSKKRNNVVLEEEQDFGALISSLNRIVESYEKLIQKKQQISSQNHFTSSTSSQSIRSRLSQSSLNPIIPSATSSTSPLFISQTLTGTMRPQSAPAGAKSRKTSLKEIDLDEFMETSNMPSLNFY